MQNVLTSSRPVCPGGQRIRLVMAAALGGLTAALASVAFAEPDLIEIGQPGGCSAPGHWDEIAVAQDLALPRAAVSRLLQLKRYNFAELCAMSRGELQRVADESAGLVLDKRAARARYLAQQRAGDDGRAADNGLMLALTHRQAMLPQAGGEQRKIASLPAGTWTALGPSNIGGRLRSILTHPTDPNWLMIGSVSGGLWKSSDAGASWAPVNDFLPNLAISSLVRDPLNPQRIYAATGEGMPNFDRIVGYGVFVSNDGGVQWSQLGGTVPTFGAPPATQQSDFQLVNRVDVHPTNSNIVLLATSGYSCSWGAVYRTENALDPVPTWTRVYSHRAMDVKFDPNNGNNVIVGEGNHCFPAPSFPSAGGAVGYSTDAGKTFTRVPLDLTTLGRVEVAWAKATPGVAVAVTEGNGGAGASGRFWVTVNGGQSWSLNSQPGHLAGQGWFNNSVWVDPTDTKRVIVGGLDLYRGDGVAAWWSSNTPLPWTKMSDRNVVGSVHADHHAIVHASNYDGTNNRVVYFGNDGGIYRSSDIASHNGVNMTANWSPINLGLAITQFYGGAGKSGYPGGVTVILGGTQDNGQLKAPPSGTGWGKFYNNEGGYPAVDPVDPTIYYGEIPYALPVRSRPVGQAVSICQGTADNVDNIKDGFAGAAGSVFPNVNCGTAATNEANFIAPMVLDPNNSSTLIVGAKSLWRTLDSKAATPVWAAIKSPSAASGNYISAVAIAPGNSNVIWVGHNNGELYCTINGTAAVPTWTKVNTIKARWTLGLHIDRNNSNRIFATYAAYTTGNVQEITDPLQACKTAPTVTNRQGNLPNVPVRVLLRHPTQANWLYVGTDVGLFASVDGGLTWGTSNDGPATVAVFDMFFLDDATIVAVTHGRGMFKANIAPITYATLDLDQNGSVDPATDGIMVLRYLLGFSAGAITDGVLAANATRVDPATIKAYLDSIRTQLDVDANTLIDAATDGLLIVRSMRGATSSALTQNALGSGAQRVGAALENYLSGLTH